MPPGKNPTKTTTKKRAPRKPAAARSAPSARAGTTFTNFVGPEQRAALIAEAAYFRAEKRGFARGYEVEDWLAAESEVDSRLLRTANASQRA